MGKQKTSLLLIPVIELVFVKKNQYISPPSCHISFIPYKESPFKEIAPIKTSSPIALATERDESGDGVRPVADPLLFGVEDEEPIGGDLSKVSCIQQSEPLKESLYG